MSRVLFYVMIMASVLYTLVGIFGYLTFAGNGGELSNAEKGGIILLADYHNSIIMKISLILISFSVLFTFPLNIKPAKESLEQLLFPEAKKSSDLRHFSLTFCRIYIIFFKNFFEFSRFIKLLAGCYAYRKYGIRFDSYGINHKSFSNLIL